MEAIIGNIKKFWQWQWNQHQVTKRLVLLSSKGKKTVQGVVSGKEVEKTTGAPPGAPPAKKETKPYTLRNKIGLFGGVLVLFVVLAMPPFQSMYGVAGKMTLQPSSADLLQKGADQKVWDLNKNGKIGTIKEAQVMMQWLASESPGLHKKVAKKAATMKNCLAVMLIMVIWWICESVPWGVTALLPAALFPLAGIATAGAASAPYGHKIIILFIAAFFIAEAMIKWGFHKRVALLIVDKIGTSPKRIVLGFMVASAFLSMWISNTATAMMMMPMALAIILHTEEVGKRLMGEGKLTGVDFTPGSYVFGSCLMLGIAFSCNSGGMGTLIGTPPNIIYSGQLELLFPGSPPVDFAAWMMFGLPVCIVTTIVIWALLVFVLRRPEIKEIPGGLTLIKNERKNLGPWGRGEKAVCIILLITSLAWIFRAEKHIGDITIWGLSTWFPWIHDSTIAVLMAILLFMIPVSFEKNEFVMTWDWALKIPWGIVLLFGGGFSLAAGIKNTGAATWVGYQLAGLSNWPLIALMVAIAVVVAVVSTVATNTATATVFMPILGTMALATSFDPRFLMILGCLASQCAYAMPVSTTCNAICFGSGYISMMDMVKVGAICSIAAIVIIIIGMLVLMGPVFGVYPHAMPLWAIGG